MATEEISSVELQVSLQGALEAHSPAAPRCDLQCNQCPVCTMQLSTRQSLRHTGIGGTRIMQPLIWSSTYNILMHRERRMCPTCRRAFFQSNISKQHHKKVHGEEGLKRKARFHIVQYLNVHLHHSTYFAKDLLYHRITCHHHHIGEFNKTNTIM